MARTDSEWTLNTIFTYFSRVLADQHAFFMQRILDAEKAVETALRSSERMRVEAREANDSRFSAVNEFRQQQQDLISGFMPRPEYNTAHQALVEKSDILANQVATMQLQITSRLDRSEGSRLGAHEQAAVRSRDTTTSTHVIMTVMSGMGILISVISLIIIYAIHH